MNAAQSVFCHAHAAAKNGSYRFRVCGREILRDLLKTIGPSKDGPMVFITYYNISKIMYHDRGITAKDTRGRRRTA